MFLWNCKEDVAQLNPSFHKLFNFQALTLWATHTQTHARTHTHNIYNICIVHGVASLLHAKHAKNISI